MEDDALIPIEDQALRIPLQDAITGRDMPASPVDTALNRSRTPRGATVSTSPMDLTKDISCIMSEYQSDMEEEAMKAEIKLNSQKIHTEMIHRERVFEDGIREEYNQRCQEHHMSEQKFLRDIAEQAGKEADTLKVVMAQEHATEVGNIRLQLEAVVQAQSSGVAADRTYAENIILQNHKNEIVNY